MPAKLSEGDTVGMTGEVTIVHDDGSPASWLRDADHDVGRASVADCEAQGRTQTPEAAA